MPISNITHLRGLAFSPDPSIVLELERLLDQARRGEVLGIAGIVEYPGQWRVVAVGAVQRDCGPYIGWMEILQQEMVDAFRSSSLITKRDVSHDRSDVLDDRNAKAEDVGDDDEDEDA